MENDKHEVMVLGALLQPKGISRRVAVELREIKIRHGLSRRFEIKWTKVSDSMKAYYLDVINYFFSNTSLHFRALVAKEKSKLRHVDFGQSHDTWYYKMYYHLLNKMLAPNANYSIYLDIKDTRSAGKMHKLKNVLRNANFDFDNNIIRNVQPVRSDEVEQVQLTDLLIGAVSYVNRDEHQKANANKGKLACIDNIKRETMYSLTKTTLMKEDKFNIFVWHPQVDPNE